MKKALSIVGFIALCCAVLLCAAGCGKQEEVSGMYIAEIEIENYGTITLELDADAAPKTVANFKKLADAGFYDGLLFHRIINGFMMQGGCPEGTGYGGSDENVEGEFAENGWDNPISHTRGVISMARSQDMNSASSQFFIVHEDSTFLDGKYAAFGCVTDGMDIVDEICVTTPVVDGNGTVPDGYKPVMTSVRVRAAD